MTKGAELAELARCGVWSFVEDVEQARFVLGVGEVGCLCVLGFR